MLSAGGASFADDAKLLDRLRLNHAAMVSSEQDFHDRQRRGSLRGAEATDYASYIARLHRLVAEDCAELARAGVALPPELECPVLGAAVIVPAAIDQTTERTFDEQLAVLDAELLSGLGDFDEMLLREQERIRAEAPVSDVGATGAGAGSGGGDGGDGEGSDGESGDASNASGRAGGSGVGMGVPNGSQARRSGERSGTPRNIPAGDDDDNIELF